MLFHNCNPSRLTLHNDSRSTTFSVAGGESVADGGAVVVTDHVITERDVALPRETGRPRRPGVQLLILQSAVCPVPVRAKDGGYFPTHIFRAIKIARDVEPR